MRLHDNKFLQESHPLITSDNEEPNSTEYSQQSQYQNLFKNNEQQRTNNRPGNTSFTTHDKHYDNMNNNNNNKQTSSAMTYK
jgi:hypothetical protein